MKIGSMPRAGVWPPPARRERDDEASRFVALLRADTPAPANGRGAGAGGGEWHVRLGNGPLAGALLHARMCGGAVRLHIVGRDAAQRAHVARCRARLCAALGELLSCDVALEFDDETA